MLDLLKDDNLKKLFQRFLKAEGDGFGIVIKELYEQDDQEIEINKEILSAQYARFFKKCKKHANLFDTNPADKTVLIDTFFGARKKTNSNLQQKHIIYINPMIYDRIEFVEVFVKECLRQNIDFDFEYTLNPKATNGITIYSTDEQLEQYKNVLSNIQTRHPDLIKRCGKTPISAQCLAWYAYAKISNRTAPAVYLGFAKTLTDYYSKTNSQIMPQDFGQQLYEVCNKSCKASYYGELDDSLLHSKFINHQNEIWSRLNSRKISYADLIDNTPMGKFCDSDGNDVFIRPCQFVEVLRQRGFDNLSHAQQTILANILYSNMQGAFNKYQINTELPSQLSNNEEKIQIQTLTHQNVTAKHSIN